MQKSRKTELYMWNQKIVSASSRHIPFRNCKSRITAEKSDVLSSTVLLISRIIYDKLCSQVNVYSHKQFLCILNMLPQKTLLTSILDVTTMFGGSKNAITWIKIFVWWMALTSRMFMGIIFSNNIGVALQLL